MSKKTLGFLAALMLLLSWHSCRVAGLKRQLYEAELRILQLQAEKKTASLEQRQMCLLKQAQQQNLPPTKAAERAATKLRRLKKRLEQAARKNNKKSLRDVLREIERLEKEIKP